MRNMKGYEISILSLNYILIDSKYIKGTFVLKELLLFKWKMMVVLSILNTRVDCKVEAARLNHILPLQ